MKRWQTDRRFHVLRGASCRDVASSMVVAMWLMNINGKMKLCLCLYFTCTKLRHILLSAETIVICKSDVIKHMLSAPFLKGRLGKWMFALLEFDIRYQPAKAVKGQALADLVADRISTDIAALFIRA